MARIDDIDWPIWNGTIAPLAGVSASRHRFGADGDIIERYGTQAPDSPIRVVNWAASEADAHAAHARMAALQGTVVACIDAQGRSWPACYVKEIRQPLIKATSANATQPDGNGGRVAVTHRLQLEVILVAQENPA